MESSRERVERLIEIEIAARKLNARLDYITEIQGGKVSVCTICKYIIGAGTHEEGDCPVPRFRRALEK